MEKEPNESKFGRKSQTCISNTFKGEYQLSYNRNTTLLVYSAITLILGLYLGMIQEKYVPQWDQTYYVDIWSISHFLISFSIYSALLYLIRNDKLTLITSIIVTTLFEPMEYIFSAIWNTGSLAWLGDIGGEMSNNTLSDIVFNILGIITAYYIYVKPPRCIEP